MVDRRRRLHRDILANLPTQQTQVSTIAVPAASIVEQMAVRRAPVTAFAPRSPAAIAYNELWAEISDLLAVRSSTAP
jgi:cellulose biosynthesis protein BcsQ